MLVAQCNQFDAVVWSVAVVFFCMFFFVCACQLKEQLPSFDLGFMEGDEFREFYKFSFQFSREGTHRTIERDIAAPLLQMVSRDAEMLRAEANPCGFASIAAKGTLGMLFAFSIDVDGVFAASEHSAEVDLARTMGVAVGLRL